jgi:chaperonin GroES
VKGHLINKQNKTRFFMSNIEPLYERVVIEPIEQEEKTGGGLIIPDTAKDKPMRGKVIAVGHGYKSEDGNITPLKVKVGDIVVYGKWGGTEVKLHNKDLVVIKESELFCIIR